MDSEEKQVIEITIEEACAILHMSQCMYDLAHQNSESIPNDVQRGDHHLIRKILENFPNIVSYIDKQEEQGKGDIDE